MMTTYTVQELAQKYAEALVEYYEAVYSDVCDQERRVRQARTAMYDAQAALNDAALRAARLTHV